MRLGVWLTAQKRPSVNSSICPVRSFYKPNNAKKQKFPRFIYAAREGDEAQKTGSKTLPVF